MLEIIPQSNFKHIPWKNGRGMTIELAINENGTLKDFDWRLSIATVNRNGLFSDFSGYTRNLVLIDGQGLELEHDAKSVDRLTGLLQFSTFDGGSKTKATLIDGPIRDFNLMTKTAQFNGRIETFINNCLVELEKSQICFIYPTVEALEIELSSDGTKTILNTGELAKITECQQLEWVVSGQNFILIYIESI